MSIKKLAAQIASTATLVWKEAQPDSVRLQNIARDPVPQKKATIPKVEDLMFKVSSGR